MGQPLMYKQTILKVSLHSGLSVVWEMASYISALSQETAEYVPGCIAIIAEMTKIYTGERNLLYICCYLHCIPMKYFDIRLIYG